MKIFKKYWPEILLIIGYLLADNLHMIIAKTGYTPNWFKPVNPGYAFHDSVYYVFHYFGQAPVLMTFVLLVTSPKNFHKIWLRFALFLVSFRDFLGEVFEMINLQIPNFGNYGYNEGTYFKIFFLIAALLIALTLKKWIMKKLKYFSSA